MRLMVHMLLFVIFLCGFAPAPFPKRDRNPDRLEKLLQDEWWHVYLKGDEIPWVIRLSSQIDHKTGHKKMGVSVYDGNWKCRNSTLTAVVMVGENVRTFVVDFDVESMSGHGKTTCDSGREEGEVVMVRWK